MNALSERLCIYTTGSFGRGDASEHSDLDLFIVSRQEAVTDKRLLTGLEEIELLASIVHVNRELGLPPLDADGEFLKVHTLSDYVVGLGKPSDDLNNTFTGRLLLMLESQPIFGKRFYDEVLDECVQRYWIDYADHSDSFLPAFLVNDILRFWRTLCVNYEAGTGQAAEKRRAKNYKLKHSRLLTCFSAIIAMQAELKRAGSISQECAKELLAMSPIERLGLAKEIMEPERAELFDDATARYARFLEETDCLKEELYEKMKDPDYYKRSLSEARLFGDAIFKIMHASVTLSSDTDPNWRFFRYLAV